MVAFRLCGPGGIDGCNQRSCGNATGAYAFFIPISSRPITSNPDITFRKSTSAHGVRGKAGFCLPRQWSLTAHVNEACSFYFSHPRGVKSRQLLGALAIEWERLELTGAKGPYDRHGYPLCQCCTARDNTRGVRDLPCPHPLIVKTPRRSEPAL